MSYSKWVSNYTLAGKEIPMMGQGTYARKAELYRLPLSTQGESEGLFMAWTDGCKLEVCHGQIFCLLR